MRLEQFNIVFTNINMQDKISLYLNIDWKSYKINGKKRKK